MIDKFINKAKILKPVIMKIFSDRFLFSVSAILACILLATQIGLISDQIRPYLSDIDVFEGQYINQIDSMINEGTISILLIDMNKENDIKILVNGIEVSRFNQKSIDVKVKNNSVVEIDGSKIKSPFKVKITGQSDNIVGELLNKEVTVNSCIEVLCRVNIK